MSGKRAKILRRLARELNETGWLGELTAVEHRPRPIVDRHGRLVGQLECDSFVWTGHRRVYQDLKRAWKRRGHPRPKIEVKE